MAASRPLVAMLRDKDLAIPAEEEALWAKDGKAEEPESKEGPRTTVIPEVEVYLSLLVLTALLRHGKGEDAVEAAEALFLSAGSINRRSLDPLRSKVFSYLALAHEKRGTGSPCREPQGRCYQSARSRHQVRPRET